ncbi:hypothetical protein [Actinomadura sp. B10D3]|uniref:hypothetical protein n=1 Tax=Actinomadura sp. B10D3 TaxID=3153557 RepID=UPI00325C7D24
MPRTPESCTCGARRRWTRRWSASPGFGYRAVPPENPYWSDHGAAVFRDPDGWRLVLAPRVFGETPPPGR